MSGPYWRGLPGETQLSLSLSLSLLCFLCNKELLQGSLARVAGEAEFQSSVASSEPPTGQGAWRRRVGEPQSKRFAANELRADTRTKSMEYVPTTGAARTLPDGAKVSCLGSDGGFLARAPTRPFRRITWRSDEGVECKRTKQELPVWVLTGTSYWGSNITYIPSIRSPAPCSRARRLLACKVSG